jgi:hypothetical protein
MRYWQIMMWFIPAHHCSNTAITVKEENFVIVIFIVVMNTAK